MRVFRMFCAVSLLTMTLAHTLAQSTAMIPASRSAAYAVAAEGGSGVSGVVFIADYGLGSTVVVVSLDGLGEAGTHPAHFHAGDCGTGGSVVVPLESVDAGTGLSVTVTQAAFETIVGGDHHLNVHRSPEDMGTIIACGEVGEGATTVAGVEASVAATQPETTLSETVQSETALSETAGPETTEATTEAGAPAEARPEELGDRIRTEGYGIFEVGGSGVSGQMQVASRAEGGTRITITLDGIDRSAEYPAAIFEGDCGPDRERLLELEPVPFEPGETSGVTDSLLSFEAIAEADNFVYIYGPGGETVVACGEVGLGANR